MLTSKGVNLYLVTNENAPNSKIVMEVASNPDVKNWVARLFIKPKAKFDGTNFVSKQAFLNHKMALKIFLSSLIITT